MSLDPRAKRLLDMMALAAPQEGSAMSIAVRREGFAKLMEMGAKPVPVATVRDLEIPASVHRLRLRLYDAVAARSEPAPALIFLHGGGWVAGSIETHDSICRGLAAASEAIIVSVGYRLGPEHRFPAPLEDAALAAEWVAASAEALGIDPLRIGIGGESAGALLAALVASGHQASTATFKSMLLLCPVIDLAGTSPSRTAFAKGYLIDADTVERDIKDCLAPGMKIDDLPSPLRHGALERTPPTIIHSAECDPFRDEAASYAELLARAGVPVRHTCHPGMVHSFQGLGAFLPKAAGALKEAGEELKAALSR